MEYTSLLTFILIVAQISGLDTLKIPHNAEYANRYRDYGGRLDTGLDTLNYPENAGYANRYRDYGGRLDTGLDTLNLPENAGYANRYRDYGGRLDTGLDTLNFPENAGYANGYRDYGGRLDRFPPWSRNQRFYRPPTTVSINTETPIATTKLFTTIKIPSTTPWKTNTARLTPTTKPTTSNTPIRIPPWLRNQRATTKVTANVSIVTETPIATTKLFATIKTPSTTPMTTKIARLTPTMKPTTPHTAIPLSLVISGTRLKYVRQTKDHKVFKHTFHGNEELPLTCTFQSQRTPHVLKMMNEFGQGTQMNSDNDYNNIDVASISHTFKINSRSKYIYCIAMDTAGRTLLTSVDLEYMALTSDSDCRSGENLQPGKLVVIKDELPPLLWTIGLVIQVFPAVDNSGISVARVLTGTGGGVPIIKPFTDLCLLNI